MREAKKSGRYLIAHSHNTNDHGGRLKRQMLQICHHIVRRYPDHFYACSKQAAEFAFGKKMLRLVIVKYSTMVLILLGIVLMKSNIIPRVRNYLWM